MYVTMLCLSLNVTITNLSQLLCNFLVGLLMYCAKIKKFLLMPIIYNLTLADFKALCVIYFSLFKCLERKRSL